MITQEQFFIQKHDYTKIYELIDLCKTYYLEGDIVNYDYLNWQYLFNPAGKPFLFTSRELSTNELAGQYLVIPVKFTVNGHIHIGTLSLNTLTKPKFQGKGLFTKMALATYTDCTVHNINFTVGFPNPQSYPGFVKKLGFKHIGDVPLLVKPLRYINLIAAYLSPKKKKHAGEIPMIKSPNDRDYLIKEIQLRTTEDLNKVNRYCNRIAKVYPVSTYKNAEYIKWRYRDIPTRKYYMYGIELDGEWQAMIVLKMENTWGFKVGLIMDFTIARPEDDYGKKLLRFAVKLLKDNKMDMVAALNTPDNQDYSLLKKQGFYSIPKKILPQQIPFIVRINKEFPESQTILNLKKWKLSFGDYDVF